MSRLWAVPATVSMRSSNRHLPSLSAPKDTSHQKTAFRILLSAAFLVGTGPSWSCPARPAGFPAVGFHRLLALGPTIRTGRFRTVSGTLLSFRLKFGDTGYRRLKHHLQLAEFLEPGANLAGYLVAPGSRNHGSELPRDWRDLNAYVLGSAGIGRNEMLSNQNEWRNGDYVSWGLAQVGCDVPLFPIPFPESPPRSNILRVSAVFLA
jgi:hypothetical protein